MRTTSRSHLHTVSTNTGRRASRDEHRSAPRLSPQLLADGVVAGYIHEISARHRDGEPETGSYDLAEEAEAA